MLVVITFCLTTMSLWAEEGEGVSNILTMDTGVPTVEVTYPNGGETFTVGETIEITWNAADYSFGANPIKIYFSYDGGASFPDSTNYLENDGSYSWQVADEATSSALVRITAFDDFGYIGYDESDYIIVNAPPQISVIPDSLYFVADPLEGYQKNQSITISNTGDSLLVVQLVPGTVTDIDGNEYQTVPIGSQLWMAENLKVTHYRNGDEIPNITSNSTWENTYTGAYCVYNNTPANADTYGNLYNWYAVDDSRDIAPEGWHVPTDEEIMEMEMALGMSQSQANSGGWRGTNEGSKLAGGYDLWANGNLRNNYEFGTSGFSFLPGGYRSGYGTFDAVGGYGGLWSSAESSSTGALYRGLYYDYTTVGRYGYDKRYGFSVRCVRDNDYLTIRQFDYSAEQQSVAQRGENLRNGWLSYTPTSFSIEPGESANVTVSVNAENLALGEYSDFFYLSSNDPLNSNIEIPVTMIVKDFVADFTVNTIIGYAPLTANFTDQSSPQDSIATWQWDFENDGVIDSYEQNPTHTYTNEGIYSVKLTVANPTQQDSLIKQNYISVFEFPYVQNPIDPIEMLWNTSKVIELNSVFAGGANYLNYSVSGNENIEVVFDNGQATIDPETNWYGTEWLNFIATDSLGTTASDTVKVNVIKMTEYTYNFNTAGIPGNWEIIHNGTTTFPWQKIYDSSRIRADSSMLVKNEGMFKTADELFITEEYNFSQSDSIHLSFWEDFQANGSSEGIFGYSSDGGYSWLPLYNVNYNTTGTVSLNLNSLSGESCIQFRWRYSSSSSMGDNWWNIDDVNLEYNCVSFSVPQVANFAISDYGTDYVSLSWDTLSIDYFSEYVVYYDSTSVVDTTSNSWNFGIDPNLNHMGCSTTTISGLSEDHYYFTICAKDGFGNISNYSDIVDIGIGDPPIICDPIPINQPYPALDSSRTVTIGAIIYDTHSNIDLSSIQYRFDTDGNGSYNEDWNDYVVRKKSRQDTANVAVDVTYTTDGDDLHFEWRVKDSVSVLYGYSGFDNEDGIGDDYIVRIDSEPPEQINDFICSDTTITTIDLEWTATTDAHFMQYEIYYSSSDSISLNDSCWSAINDTSLYNIQTTQTTIYGIDNSTDKYFAICAIDSVGNRSTFSNVILNVPITYPPYCFSPYPNNQPEPVWSTSRTVQVGVTFYDYYGIDTTTVQCRYDKDGNGLYGTGEEWQDVYSRSGEIILISGNKKNTITENKKVTNKANESNILFHDGNTEKKVIKEKQNDVNQNITYIDVKLLDKLRASAVDTVVARINAIYNVDGDSLHFEFRAKDVNGYGYTYSGFNNEEGIQDDYVVKIDATPPDSITFAQSGYPTDSTLTVAWDTSNDEFFDTYQIYYATHPNVTETDSLLDKDNDPSLTDSLQFFTTITGLDPVTTYYFKVRAVDLAGNEGGFSPECHSTTSGVYPPASPENLCIVVDNDSMNVILSWDAVTQDTGGNPILIDNYRIYNSSNPGFEASSNYLLDIVSDTTYTHENVLQVGKMFYKVTAQTAGEVMKTLSAEQKKKMEKMIDELLKRKVSSEEETRFNK